MDLDICGSAGAVLEQVPERSAVAVHRVGAVLEGLVASAVSSFVFCCVR